MAVSEFVSEETKRRIGFMMKFTKMQAFGNDYVYIDAIHQELKNLPELARFVSCLLYTSDAADEEDSVDLGVCRIH